jgi:hypothetical protein
MWVFTPPPDSHDFLDIELPLYEAIMEVMDSVDEPRHDMLHYAYFLLDLERLEDDIKILASTDNFERYQPPIMTHDVFPKGNLADILKTIPIDILVNPIVMEHIMIGAYYSL